MTILATLALLLASADGERLRIRIKEPTWTQGTFSVQARLPIVAVIPAGDSLGNAWLEFRQDRSAEWQRLDIPPDRFVRLSEEATLVCPILEPRTLPGVRAGQRIHARIVANRRSETEESSWTLQIDLEEAEEREALVLRHLEEVRRELEDLRQAFERDHRRLSRIERQSRDAEKLELRVRDELWSIDRDWGQRVETFEGLSKDWSHALDEAVPDRLVDGKRADRCRQSIERFLRDSIGEDGTLRAMRRNLGLAAQAESAAERRVRFLAMLDASDRLLDLLQKPEGDFQVWRESISLRRLVRSALATQKDVTEELDPKRKR